MDCENCRNKNKGYKSFIHRRQLLLTFMIWENTCKGL